LPAQNPSQGDLNRVGTYLRAQASRLSAPKISYSPEQHSPALRKRASQQDFLANVHKASHSSLKSTGSTKNLLAKSGSNNNLIHKFAVLNKINTQSCEELADIPKSSAQKDSPKLDLDAE